MEPLTEPAGSLPFDPQRALPSPSVQSQPENLTVRQAARREAVLRAAVELAAEGGYDAVQIRSVAQRADVALGTIYHYFSSKDVLLAAAMVEWVGTLEDLIRDDPPHGDNTRERVLDVLGRVTRIMRGAPDVSHAMVTAMCSRGEEFDRCQEQMHRVWSNSLDIAFDTSFGNEERNRIIRVLEHVWFSNLIAWTNEWMSLEQASDELTNAAEALLGPTTQT
jgi:AcrR family transcriptional regulator